MRGGGGGGARPTGRGTDRDRARKAHTAAGVTHGWGFAPWRQTVPILATRRRAMCTDPRPSVPGGLCEGAWGHGGHVRSHIGCTPGPFFWWVCPLEGTPKAVQSGHQPVGRNGPHARRKEEGSPLEEALNAFGTRRPYTRTERGQQAYPNIARETRFKKPECPDITESTFLETGGPLA